MSIWMRRFCVCMALLCVGAVSTAQEEQPAPPQAPSSAAQPEEALLMQAMEHNPDIRTAKAELEKARAELEATRIRVAREVLTTRQQLEALKKVLKEERMRAAGGITSYREFISVELEFHEAENQMQYLLGNIGGRSLDSRPGGRGGFGGGFSDGVGGFAALAQMRIPQPRPAYEEGTPENLKEILEQRVSNITFEDISVTEIFGFLSDMYEINVTIDLAFPPPTIRQIELWKLPLHDVFLALSDQMGDACFVIRDYGLFLTTRERAQTLAGPTIPEDVPYLALTFGGSVAIYPVSGLGDGDGGIGAGGGGSAGPGSARGEAPAAP